MISAFKQQSNLLCLAAALSLLAACGGRDANPNPAVAGPRTDLIAACPMAAITACPIDPGGGGTTCTPNCPLYGACGSSNGCGGTCTSANSQCINESYFQNDCATGFGTCYGVRPPPNYYADSDHDGLYDGLEYDLMNRFMQHAAMGCVMSDIGSFYPSMGYVIPVRVHKVNLSGGRHVGQFIEIRYGMAFDWDSGSYSCPDPVTQHPGDSEVYAVLLDMNYNPVDYNGSSHGRYSDGDYRWPAAAFAWVDPARRDYGPRVTRYKHAQANGYEGCGGARLWNPCGDTCAGTDCEAGPSTRGRMQNVGEPNDTGSFSPVIRRAAYGGPYNVWTNSTGFGSAAATDYRYGLGDSIYASPVGYHGQDICWNCN